jgi:C1A family cysteine protease
MEANRFASQSTSQLLLLNGNDLPNGIDPYFPYDRIPVDTKPSADDCECEPSEDNDEKTRTKRQVQFNYPPAPNELDYRTLGYVSNVEDQGFTCSSCYAYASLCALEGQIFKKYGNLPILSEQQIVDCSRVFNNQGCSVIDY